MKNAERIVSLLPGATEWVCALGLKDRLVGVSHECNFPDHVKLLPRVTRSRIESDLASREIDETVRLHSETRTPLYSLDAPMLARLQPDLILTQSLCNVCAVSEADVVNCVSGLDKACRVLDMPSRTFDDVIGDARTIAQATGNNEVSLAVIASLQKRIAAVHQQASASEVNVSSRRRPKVTLLEWTDPLYCSGHWTPQLIDWAGGVDPIGEAGQPSRAISFSSLVEADPDILLVACCGMDVDRSRNELASLETHRDWSKLRASMNNHVHVFDGSAYFNRPGPRLVETLEEVARIIDRWHSSP